MDKLEQSNYFGEVRVETRSATYQGARIQSFVLNGKLSYAGNLRTDPKKAQGALAAGGSAAGGAK